jgi:hypothetical protein
MSDDERKLSEYVDKWTRIGLATGACADRPAVEAALKKVYAAAELPQFDRVVWVDSIEAGIDAVIGLANVTRKTAIDSVIYGSHEVGWLAFYDYMRHELGCVSETDDLAGFFEVAEHIGCFWCLENVVVVAERPTALRLDDAGNLHCEDASAVQFADDRNANLYWWHGHEVPEQVILRPETITVSQIKQEQNAETRRIMVERYGLTKYLNETGAEVLDVDHQPVDSMVPSGASIRRMLVQDDAGDRYMICTDGSSDRVHVIPALATDKTCVEVVEGITKKPESDCIGRS